MPVPRPRSAVGSSVVRRKSTPVANANIYAEREQAYEQQMAPPVAPAPAPAGGASTTDQLKELADLHSAGALTDAEFQAAKAKLLG